MSIAKQQKNNKTHVRMREKIREDLLTYCGQDTLAMLKIREELLKRLA